MFSGRLARSSLGGGTECPRNWRMSWFSSVSIKMSSDWNVVNTNYKVGFQNDILFTSPRYDHGAINCGRTETPTCEDISFYMVAKANVVILYNRPPWLKIFVLINLSYRIDISFETICTSLFEAVRFYIGIHIDDWVQDVSALMERWYGQNLSWSCFRTVSNFRH